MTIESAYAAYEALMLGNNPSDLSLTERVSIDAVLRHLARICEGGDALEAWDRIGAIACERVGYHTMNEEEKP